MYITYLQYIYIIFHNLFTKFKKYYLKNTFIKNTVYYLLFIILKINLLLKLLLIKKKEMIIQLHIHMFICKKINNVKLYSYSYYIAFI